MFNATSAKVASCLHVTKGCVCVFTLLKFPNTTHVFVSRSDGCQHINLSMLTSAVQSRMQSHTVVPCAARCCSCVSDFVLLAFSTVRVANVCGSDANRSFAHAVHEYLANSNIARIFQQQPTLQVLLRSWPQFVSVHRGRV